MRPIPFENTWPYERQMGEIYVDACPYCSAANVLTHMRHDALERAKDGVKTRLNFPCCYKTMIILEADEDYFWADEPLR